MKNQNSDSKTVYCHLLLLNRRCPGELQRLLITTYKSACENQSEQAYEEFTEAVSETEKVLMKSFLRIVIRKKRGRSVPVLITKDVKEHLNLLLLIWKSQIKRTDHWL
nr:unnamed protein product [Callosobruchus analis]